MPSALSFFDPEPTYPMPRLGQISLRVLLASLSDERRKDGFVQPGRDQLAVGLHPIERKGESLRIAGLLPARPAEGETTLVSNAVGQLRHSVRVLNPFGGVGLPFCRRHGFALCRVFAASRK
jgi:hypothetical protein